MGKLHELLAAEKTPTAAWNALLEDTKKKFGNAPHFFEGHSKFLKMIEDNPANTALEQSAREEKAVPTNVYETLEYALGIFANAEDVQYQKNATNRLATADVVFRGKTLLKNMPVDELLGLESRLTHIRGLYVSMPTIDASKHWVPDPDTSKYVFKTALPEVTTKTEKEMTPVIMAPATDKHPAQVQAVSKDKVVGSFSMIKRTGAVTAVQKSDAIKLVDDLLVEIKQARMRANETEAVNEKIGQTLVDLLLSPLKPQA